MNRQDAKNAKIRKRENKERTKTHRKSASELFFFSLVFPWRPLRLGGHLDSAR
jgi:hypothetical protein